MTTEWFLNRLNKIVYVRRDKKEVVVIKSILILLFLSLPLIIYSQGNGKTVTITTYYPSPYGVYRVLRLHPTTDIDPFSACTHEGDIFYCDFDDTLYFCNGSNWQALTTYWSFDPDNNWLYPKDPNWKVGIGLTNPNNTIQVANLINFDNSLSSTFLGYQAGHCNTSGTANTFIGYEAGKSNTTGDYNTFIGFEAGESNTTGDCNTFIGFEAGESNTTGYANTFIGLRAGRSNTTSGHNTFIGYEAGENTTGHYNTFIGSGAGRSNTSGYFNTFIGSMAGESNTTGRSNTFIGHQAGESNTTGYNNTFIGFEAGGSNTTGGTNTFIGAWTGYRNTGSGNVFIGYRAGYYETGSNKLYIDNSSTSTPLIYGEFDNDKLVINGELHVSGVVYAADFQKHSDIAEYFLVRGKAEEGDVVVVDLSSKEGLTKSKKPYSSLVIGVISENPALIIGGKKGENYKPVALKGVVLTKVIGPVKRGDILVTSNKEGYAMRADLKKIFSPTQVVGIALEELKEKEGKIRVFVR